MTASRFASGSIHEPRTDRYGGFHAELRVRPEDGHACPLRAGLDDQTVVGHDLVCPGGSCQSSCECRATIKADGETRMVGKPLEAACICPVFRDHDCVSSITAVREGDIVVSISLPSRDVLTSIIAKLRDRNATVELRSITHDGPSGHEPSIRQLTLDANAITKKQREAIEVAFEAGYYASPRTADLGDLADRLGVSRSAVSQRLTAAESTLMEQVYEHESRIGAAAD